MPNFPELSEAALGLRESLFARLAGRLAAHRGEVYPLHLGDTCRPPSPTVGRAIAAALEDPAIYRYGPPGGDPALVERLVDKCRTRNALPWVDKTCMQVTTGATLAMSVAARAVLEPGDEVLLCAPYWPLIRGIVTSAGAVPVEVPLTQRLYAESELDPYELLAEHTTERTKAVYVTTPNNPDGKVLSRADLERIAAFARELDLWVLADEVYEDYVFDGEHVSIASVEGMSERTITAWSFSKSHALAGLRLGYVAADPQVLAALRRLANHAVYNVPVALQRAALAALSDEEWVARARAAYREARDLASGRLELPHFLPDGGAYLYADLTPVLGEVTEQRIVGLHEHLLDAGVLLAPGGGFGAHYTTHARLCYTALPLDRLAAGIDRLGEALRSYAG